MSNIKHLIALALLSLSLHAHAGCVVNTQLSTTSYTAVLSDANQCIAMNNTAANTVTVPLNAAVPFPRRTTLTIQNVGTGITTVSVAGTWNFFTGAPTTLGQYQQLTLRQTALDVWYTESFIPGKSAIAQVAQTIATSAVATLTASIPAGYTNLQIVITGRCDAAATTSTLQLQFNGDNGTNYDSAGNSTTGASNNVFQAQSTATPDAGFLPCANATANRSSVTTLTVGDYSSTVFDKLVSGLTATSQSSSGGSTFTQVSTVVWRPATPAAITSVTVSLSAGNFLTGSKLTVYGML